MPNLTAITNRATEAEAKGILPPIMRAVAHVAFMLAMIQMERDANPRTASNEELLGEMDHIRDHWTLIGRPTYIPDTIRNEMQTVTDQIPTLRESVTADSRDALQRNLLTFYKNLVSLASALDTSLMGLQHPRDTDAGRNL